MEPLTVDARQPRRWTRVEYERMIDAGIFGPDEHAELLDGEILMMTPQKSPHATGVQLVADTLRLVFVEGTLVRVQLPMALDDFSEPEPDVAIVQGVARDYRDAHPASALLVVEVSDSTLIDDRHRKGSLYARAGIADYWLLNLKDRVLEVYRDPVANPEARYGSSYRLVNRLGPDESASPLARPGATVAIADLLP